MKKIKIVKRITSLTIVGTLAITMISCSKQMVVDNTIDTSTSQNDIIIDENGNNTFVDSNGNEITTDHIDNSETEKQESVNNYNPLDFKAVTNFEATFEELIGKREKYYEHMKSVLSFKMFYSEEEIATSIYNVVRIDSDLSNLLVKINAQKQQEIQGMVYLADQIETLEKVLNNMNDLKQKIEESKEVYSSSLKDISKADAEQIEKVYKFSLNPLNAPIKKLEKDIGNLKVELEEALANQP